MIINDISDIYAVINMILGLLISFWDLYFYFKVKTPERWTKLVYSMIGFLWFLRYLLLFLFPETCGTQEFGDVWVRGLITFTLASFLVGSIIRVRRTFTTEEIKCDFKDRLGRVKTWILHLF